MELTVNITLSKKEYDTYRKLLDLSQEELEYLYVLMKQPRKTIHEAGLPTQAANALDKCGWKYLDEVVYQLKINPEKLLLCKNIGESTLEVIKDTIKYDTRTD